MLDCSNVSRGRVKNGLFAGCMAAALMLGCLGVDAAWAAQAEGSDALSGAGQVAAANAEAATELDGTAGQDVAARELGKVASPDATGGEAALSDAADQNVAGQGSGVVASAVEAGVQGPAQEQAAQDAASVSGTQPQEATGVKDSTAVEGRADEAAPAEAAADGAVTVAAEAATADEAPAVAEGAYTIKSKATYGQALSTNGSLSNNAAVSAAAIDGDYDQLFFIQKVKESFYSIFSVSSGLALSVADGATVQSTYKEDDAHLFELRGVDGLFALVSKSGKAVTVPSAGGAAKAQKYTGARTQLFDLVEAPLVVPGVQVLRSGAATGSAIAIKDASQQAGAQAQLVKAGGSDTTLTMSRSGDKYVVRPMTSGMYLTASNTAVSQKSETFAWSVDFASAGARRGLMLVDEASGKAAQAASTGKAIAMAAAAPSAAQSFLPSATQLMGEGYYVIASPSGKAVDVYNGSYSSGANIWSCDQNGTGAQVFYFQKAANGAYVIRSSKSYKVLDAKGGGTSNGTNVWQCVENGTVAQLWVPVVDAGGRMALLNAKSGKALTITGTNIDLRTSSGAANQHWVLKATSQYSETGSTELDKIVANILGTHTTLRSAFNYVAGSAFSYRNGNKHWSGWSLSDATSRSYAIEMYNYGSGNCYRFAALFSWLARALGYSTTVRTGWVVGYSAPQAPHGWVEVHTSSGTFLCDPDMQHEAPSRNWYWTTYATSPTVYYSW